MNSQNASAPKSDEAAMQSGRAVLRRRAAEIFKPQTWRIAMTQPPRLRDIYLSRQWLIPSAIFFVMLVCTALLMGAPPPDMTWEDQNRAFAPIVLVLGSIYGVLLYGVDWNKVRFRMPHVPPEIRAHWKLWLVIIVAFALGIGALALLEYHKHQHSRASSDTRLESQLKYGELR